MGRMSASREPSARPARPSQPLAPPSARVDAWLWAIRATRTRSQANAAARAGHVKINGTTAKASQRVAPGDEVRLRVAGFDRVLRVVRPIVKRVGPAAAAACYVDHSPPRPRLALGVPLRAKGSGRPTKKERRELDRLRGRDSHEHWR